MSDVKTAAYLESQELRSFRGDKPAGADDYRDIRRNFPYRPTIFLGLGGTGCNAVAKIKSLFQRVFEVPGPDGKPQGVPSMYAFLGFDADMSNRPSALENNIEWFHTGIKDVRVFLDNAQSSPFMQSWLPKGISEGSFLLGAGGYRTYGRLCFTANIDTFKKEVGRALNTVLRANDTLNINFGPIVYIFSSLSGGAGAGMLLDATFCLAAEYPNVSRVGYVAILDGLSSMSAANKEKCLVGTYAGLKELHAFMSENFGVAGDDDDAPSIGGEFDYGLRSVRGRYDQPFEKCYLLLTSDARGARRLPTQSHVSSVMARCAFASTAYHYEVPIQGGGDAPPTMDGQMLNRMHEFAQERMGVRLRYIVPGLSQLHVPAKKSHQWLALRAAERFLLHLQGGSADDGDQAARDMALRHKISATDLKEALAFEAPETPLTASDYGSQVDRLMKNRYAAASQITALGKSLPGQRMAEFQTAMNATAAGLLASFEADVRAEVARMLSDSRFLRLGATDFLGDLESILRAAVKETEEKDADLAQSFENLARTWSAVSEALAQVIKDSGPIDRARDKFRVPRVTEMFKSYLHRAEHAALDRAKLASAREWLALALQKVDGLRQELTAVFEQGIRGACEELRAAREKISEALKSEEQGGSESLDGILSLSLISAEMREKWLKEDAVVQSANMLSELIKGEWTPFKWLALGSSKLGPGVTTASAIAEDVYERVKRLTARYGMISLTDVMGHMGGEQEDAARALARLVSDVGAPLAPIAGHKEAIMDNSPEPTAVIAGVPEALFEQLRQVQPFAQMAERFTRAQTHEEGRITYFAVTLPVGLPGVSSLRTVFKPAYDRFMKTAHDLQHRKSGGVDDRQLFHSFPGSERWPDPVDRIKDADEVDALFAKTYALGFLMQPSTEDVEAMNAISKSPKEKRYGLFRIGASDYWLWPFFAPRTAGRKIDHKPIKLGSNVLLALRHFRRSEEARTAARAWCEWFDGAWPAEFSTKEFAAALQGVLKDIPYQSIAGDEVDGAWLPIIRYLEWWHREFAGSR